MRVLVAPQEFKGSLTAVEAAAAIGQGVQRVYPEAVIDSAPVADGGPGTVEAIVHAATAAPRLPVSTVRWAIRSTLAGAASTTVALR